MLQIEAEEDEQVQIPAWRMALIILLEGQEGDDSKALPKLLLNVLEQPKKNDSEMSSDNAKDESGSSTGSYEAQGQVGAEAVHFHR